MAAESAFQADAESFLQSESKVTALIKMLDDMANANAQEDMGTKDKRKPESEMNVEAAPEFVVFRRTSREVASSRSTKQRRTTATVKPNLDQFTFIRQLDQTPEERQEVLRVRERVADNFRRLGNHAFRMMNFKNAIYYYAKGLEHVNDTPVLYCNRAIAYIKTAQYKRALMDIEHVIMHLDQRCLRAWLYRAAAYKRLGDVKNFEISVSSAKQFNTREQAAINDFVSRLDAEL